jgi:predicted SAM-dependent methyltransferase
MDKRDLPGVDIVHDVEVFPWPIEDDSVHVLMMSHIVEHIKPWLQIEFMNEAWRVLKPDGMLMVSTPYGGSYRYNQDPTHCSPWNEATVAYFVKGTELYNVYKPKPWKQERCNYFIQGDLEVILRKDDTNSTRKK